MNGNSRINNLLEAIEAERLHEEEYYRSLSSQKSIQEKVKAGILCYPLKLVRKFYTVGENIEIQLERNAQSNLPHKLKIGAGVILFTEQNEYRATISYLRKNIISVILSNKDLDHSILENDRYGVELVYDERPYTVMKGALNDLKENQETHIKELKNGIESLSSFAEIENWSQHEHYENIKLNKFQNQALRNCAAATQLAIIHGPPGTGKTTTLVELIHYISKSNRKILVCASSNNAVDLLAYLLHKKGLPVLRIGNVSRINDEITQLTIGEQLRNHPDWQHIKKVKIEAQEAKKQAAKFKRSFGVKDRNHRNTMYKESRELRKWARDLEAKLVDNIIDDAKIICSTLIGASNKIIKDIYFDTLVIDEASQALEPECWNAMLKAKKVIFAGDHLQLPPTVKTTEAKNKGLETTLLDRLSSCIKHCHLLQEQYRMNDHILGFSNKFFYDDKLLSNEVCKNRFLDSDDTGICFIDTSGCGFEESMNPESRSLSNSGEYFILREHFLENKDLFKNYSIGIIAPYAQQVRLIREKIGEDECYREVDITVNSIDGFQGQEKDIIYLSLVRSNESGTIGFLKDYRRINVALTRAKMKLIIIGDGVTLGQDNMYNALMEHFEKNGSYLSAWEFMK